MPNSSSHVVWNGLAVAILLLLSILVKLPIWQLPPQVFNDSPGYLVPALGLLSGRGYGAQENAFRTPTYPLILAALIAPFDRSHLSTCQNAHDTVCIGKAAATPDGRFDLDVIVVAQALLGLAIVLLLYHLGWHLTCSRWIGLLWGGGYALNIGTAFWESSILSETLTIFLLALALDLTFVSDDTNGWHRLALGFVLGALALCHSVFLVYWLLPVGLLIFRNLRLGWRSALVRAAPVALTPLAFLGLWASYNAVVNGYFSVSTLTGYVMIQKVAPVVQNAPAGYDGITEIYVGYRDAMMQETGSYVGTVYRAWPAMMRETGLTFSQLSNKLVGLSLYLMIAYPQSYIDVTRIAWDRFWGFPLYNLAAIPAGPPQWMAWFTNSTLQGGLNIAFGLCPLLLLLLWFARGKETRIPFGEITFIIVTVLFVAVMVAMTNLGDNARYHSYVLPLQYGTIFFMIWAGWQAIHYRMTR